MRKQPVKKLDEDIVELPFIIDVPDLKGGEKIRKVGLKYYAQVEFEGE